jgi:hypothetical protein
LLVPKAHDVYSIYTECLSFKVPPPPEYPRAELPRPDIKIVADGARRRLRKLYTRELPRAENVQQAANQLQNEFAEQKRKAEEARDLIDIHIAKEKLAYDKQLAPITNVYKEYSAHTRNGIAGHFQLALGTLALPMPANFPWSTFYDANERLLQINQRVPFVADIVVKRADSKRPQPKRIPIISYDGLSQQYLFTSLSMSHLTTFVRMLTLLLSIAGADISNAQLGGLRMHLFLR